MPKPVQEIFCTHVFCQILILTLGSFLLGIVVAYPSPVIPDLRKFADFTSFDESLFAASPSLTAIVGPFITNPILNNLGRRPTARTLGTLFIISWLFMLITTPGHKYFAHLHRALIGIATGGVNSVIPVYIMETSPSDLRSVYGSMHQFSISFGIFTVNLLGIFLNWWGIALFALLVSIIFTLSLAVVPEPPVFGRGESGASDSLCGTRYRRGLLIGLALMFFQQVSGVNAVLVNLSAILSAKSGPAFAASAQCFAVVCCIGAIERIGRLNAWFASLFGSAGSMFLLAAALWLEWSKVVATVAMFGFLFCFCFGLGPIPWFLPPELFPDNLRGTATSILASVNSAVSFAVIFLYPQCVATFGVCSVIAAFGIVLVAGGLFGFVAFRTGGRERPGAVVALP